MITPMRKITVYGVQSSRKPIIEELQKTGCVEFSFPDENSNLKSPDVTSAVMQFDRYIASSSSALAVLEEYEPEKTGLFSVRKDISIDRYSMSPDEINTIGAKTLEIIKLKKNIDELRVNITREKSLIASYEPWLRLDVPMNTSGSDKTDVLLVNIPYDLTVQKMDEILGEETDFVYYEIISSASDLSCVFLVCPKDKTENITKLLRENGFSVPSAGLSHRTPADKIKHLNKKIDSLTEEIRKTESQIREYAVIRGEIKLFYDHLVMRREKYKNLEKVSLTEDTFIIEGYIPKNKENRVREKLTKCGLCAVEFSDVSPDEEAPVLLSNNAFVKPVENITTDYSIPSKKDIDPNGIMCIFYYMFFGMMFSDAGYGILLALVAGYIGFIAKVESGTKQFMRMFFYCGLSTTFWGFMFGSFFGDAIAIKPLFMNPVEKPLEMLIFSVILGFIQILTGLGIKFYMSYRSGEKVSAFFDTGSWILILVGAGFGALSASLKNSTLVKVGVGIAIAGALCVLLMNGRDKKNPFSRLISGVTGLYDVTSYVSDLLSYSRLMALGLATGVIGNVVNLMAGLVGDGILGTIVFVILFIIGHAMNFAINVLGAYVHTNRLQYVEFYSKFYEGGGRKFAPLSMNTKYYKFLEDEK